LPSPRDKAPLEAERRSQEERVERQAVEAFAKEAASDYQQEIPIGPRLPIVPDHRGASLLRYPAFQRERRVLDGRRQGLGGELPRSRHDLVCQLESLGATPLAPTMNRRSNSHAFRLPISRSLARVFRQHRLTLRQLSPGPHVDPPDMKVPIRHLEPGL
jgi:hypothetical protein